MCDFDHEETCVVLHDVSRRARKPHVCNECRRVIAAGETYSNLCVLFDGTKETHRICSHCLVAREWLRLECGGYAFEHVREDTIEHYHEGYTQLGRLAAGIRRRWLGFKRALLPIPTRPPTTHELERLENSNA